VHRTWPATREWSQKTGPMALKKPTEVNCRCSSGERCLMLIFPQQLPFTINRIGSRERAMRLVLIEVVSPSQAPRFVRLHRLDPRPQGSWRRGAPCIDTGHSVKDSSIAANKCWGTHVNVIREVSIRVDRIEGVGRAIPFNQSTVALVELSDNPGKFLETGIKDNRLS